MDRGILPFPPPFFKPRVQKISGRGASIGYKPIETFLCVSSDDVRITGVQTLTFPNLKCVMVKFLNCWYKLVSFETRYEGTVYKLDISEPLNYKA